jgi:hypothetical protein
MKSIINMLRQAKRTKQRQAARQFVGKARRLSSEVDSLLERLHRQGLSKIGHMNKASAKSDLASKIMNFSRGSAKSRAEAIKRIAKDTESLARKIDTTTPKGMV